MDFIERKIKDLEKKKGELETEYRRVICKIDDLKNIQGNEVLLKKVRLSLFFEYQKQLKRYNFLCDGKVRQEYKDRNDEIKNQANKDLKAFDAKYPIPNFDYNCDSAYFNETFFN